MVNKQYKTIDNYISSFPSDCQQILGRIRLTIKEVAPEASEVISYGLPTLRLDGKILVHFTAFKKHIGFYPTPSAIEGFRGELSQYENSKGTVKFPVEKAIPLDDLSRF